MYSFDIYDTLITRTVKNPNGIFLLMEELLNRQYPEINQTTRANFATVRVLAEKEARKLLNREITLDDIYGVMLENYGITETEKRRLMELEVDCEVSSAVPIPQNVERAMQLFRSGERVVMISDMYLQQADMRRILGKAASELLELPLYLSSEIGVTKAAGLLYPYIKEKEGTAYADWTHVGDNSVSDQSIPELFGIKIEPYRMPDCDVWIRRLEDFCRQKNSLILQYLGGLNRISVFLGKTKAYRLGYSCFSVVLYSYVNWVLDTALKKGIRRLFFIARDGYILKKIADIVIEINSLPIQTCELYGSRKAWNPQNAEEEKRLAGYIRQELGDNLSDYALVDTQGTGRSAARLSEICGHQITIFYFALLGKKGNQNIRPYSYCGCSQNGLIEVLCRAPYGSTIGYREEGDRIEPVFSEWNSAVWEKAKLDEYVCGIEAFAREFTFFCRRNHFVPSMIGTAEDILHYGIERPDREMADFIGDIPHNDRNEDDCCLYAPKLTTKEIYQIEVERTIQELQEFYKGVNLEYSYLRLDSTEKKFLEQCKKMYWANKKENGNEGCIRLVVYGYGKYGRELLHRVYRADGLQLVAVVDADNRRYQSESIAVEKIARLRQEDYDVVVVSLKNENVGKNIAQMLEAAGISKEKIYLRQEFIKHFMEDVS